MTDQKTLPFQSFAFTLIEDRRPRTAFRMTAVDGGMYELHVEKGSAANPVSQFTRTVPLEVAQRLKDALQDIGVFGWAEEYGNASGGVSRRWNVNTVFKEEKKDHCTGKDCILIDDLTGNIEEWEMNGGTGLLFRGTEGAMKKLKELGVL